MAALVPGFMCRKAIAGGRFGAAAVPALGAVFISALVSGVAALILGAALWMLVLWTAGAETIGGTAALVLKLLYGAALGALVTAINLRRMLR